MEKALDQIKLLMWKRWYVNKKKKVFKTHFKLYHYRKESTKKKSDMINLFLPVILVFSLLLLGYNLFNIFPPGLMEPFLGIIALFNLHHEQ